ADGSALVTTAHGIEVVLAEHVVEVDAGARHDHAGAGAVRGSERGGVAGRVDDGDVGRPGGADGLGPTGLAGFDPLCSGVHTGEEALCETAAIEVAREAAAASACLLSHHLGHALHRLSAPGRPSDAE